MMHISFAIKYSDEDFEKALATSWVHGALYYYNRDYNFDEKTDEQGTLVKTWRQRLTDTMPEEYRTGCHCIGPRAAFMGEDIWVADADIQHAAHVKHKICEKYSVVWKRKTSWCAVCDCATVEADLTNL